MDSAKAIRDGLPVKLVEDVAVFLRIRREILCEHLRIDASSVDRRINLNESLSSWEAGRLYLVFKLFLRAVEVFELSESVVDWLGAKIPALGGVPPLSLLDTPAGFDLVLDTLGQLEAGVFA